MLLQDYFEIKKLSEFRHFRYANEITSETHCISHLKYINHFNCVDIDVPYLSSKDLIPNSYM